MNVLVTGQPSCGKSTALERAASRLRSQGYEVGGVKAPEIKDAEGRVGFRLVDVATGLDAMMAHVDRNEGPRVGQYRVDVKDVDEVSRRALSRARKQADAIVIDEIGPMEVASDVFIEQARACLDGPAPVLGAIHQASGKGFIGEVKDRADVDVLVVDEGNREAVPSVIVDRVLEALDR